MTFGDAVQFHGAYHGVIAFIVVVTVMLAAEELTMRLHRSLR